MESYSTEFVSKATDYRAPAVLNRFDAVTTTQQCVPTRR